MPKVEIKKTHRKIVENGNEYVIYAIYVDDTFICATFGPMSLVCAGDIATCQVNKDGFISALDVADMYGVK